MCRTDLGRETLATECLLHKHKTFKHTSPTLLAWEVTLQLNFEPKCVFITAWNQGD